MDENDFRALLARMDQSLVDEAAKSPEDSITREYLAKGRDIIRVQRQIIDLLDRVRTAEVAQSLAQMSIELLRLSKEAADIAEKGGIPFDKTQHNVLANFDFRPPRNPS